MQFTEVRVQLLEGAGEPLRAVVSLTIDHCLVIRDIKVIECSKGLIVVMPSRRPTESCQHCDGTNPVRVRYCNNCGKPLPNQGESADLRGKQRVSTSIAHPINKAGRKLIDAAVLDAYRSELVRSQTQDYVPQHIDGLDYGDREQRESGAESYRGSSAPGSSRRAWRSVPRPPLPRQNPPDSA